ncbi:uncharacterized protein LOC114329479 isoform X1 [Diabrotica virgifera virgifera]|uniref:Uncharacterized protein n=1 Tax=Diabrotica virgifera virgifera TaxID=50390 RepID=A0ABM5IJR1_DIAVI|nr:uncharacterized protein LOC114329479 isoform X1 [Diabrotica virgifera virgifera]XP_028134402.2 uncharacterized protein LOC114329479 isoform X1 [Diabrotica virgifera virgifera]
MKNEMKSTAANTSTNNRNDTQASQKSSASDEEPMHEVVNKDTGRKANRMSDVEFTSFGDGTEHDVVKKVSMETTDPDPISIFSDADDPIFSMKTDRSGSTNDACHFKAGASTSRMSTNKFQDNNGNLEQEDVSKLLKLLSKPNLMSSPWDKRKNSKTPLKTYSNPRKSSKESAIIESFGLPDTSIIPEKSSKPGILDANVSDASEITLEALKFGDESWCVDFAEDFLVLSEIRVKACPQNHVLVNKSLNSSMEASTPVKQGSSAIMHVKNKFNGAVANSKPNSNYLLKNDVNISPNKSDIVIKKNNLTIDEHEVEFFSSNGTSTPNSTTIKTNRLDKSVQKEKESHRSKSTPNTKIISESYIDKTPTNDNTSSEKRTLRSDATRDNTNQSKDTTPHKSREISSLESQCSGETRKLRSFTAPGTPSEFSSLESQRSGKTRKLKSSSVPGTPSELSSLESQCSGETQKLKSSTEPSTPSELNSLESQCSGETQKLKLSTASGTSSDLSSLESQCSGETRKLRSSTAPGTPTELSSLESQYSGKTRKLKSSTAPGTPSELSSLESQCSGETRKLRSSTTPGTPSEISSLESQRSGKARKLKLSTVPSTPSKLGSLESLCSGETQKLRSSTAPGTPSELSPLESHCSGETQKLKPSTAHGTPLELGSLESQCSGKTQKLKSSTAPGTPSEHSLLESQCSGETRKLRSSTAPDTPSEHISLENQCSGETRKLRSSTAPSTPSEPSKCSKTNDVFSNLTVNLQTDFQTTKTTPVSKMLSSTDFNKQKLKVTITKETSSTVNNKPKAVLTKTTSDPNIQVSSKEKNEKMKCVSDSEVSRNEDYVRQLKIILHPLRTPMESPKAKQAKRRSTRLNISQDSKTTNEKKSASREMILQLVDVIPVPDKEEYKSPLLKNPAFVKLFQKEECPLLDVLMNKDPKMKVKANRKQEPKSCGHKANSTTHNLPSTSKNEDLPVISQNSCSKLKENYQQTLEVKAIDHNKSNTEPQCSSSDREASRIESVKEADAYKSPTPKSPTKFYSNLKKSPEMLELKSIIQKISESEGRRCKVTTNEKLSECLKSRQYNKKPSSSTSNLTDNTSSNPSLNKLETPDKIDLNSERASASSTNHFLSPTDNLRGRTRKIIEMLADDDQKTVINQKYASEAKQREIKSVVPVETTNTNNTTTKNELQESSNDLLNIRPVKNQTSSKGPQTIVESTKKVNRSNKLLLSEKEIDRNKENNSRSSSNEENIPNLEPKSIPKQSNQNVPTENLKEQDNNCSNSAERNVSLVSHDILICKETKMSCDTTQANIETQNGTTNVNSTKDGEDKDKVCTVSLAKAKETNEDNQSDTLSVAQNNNTVKALDTSRSTAKENDLCDQNKSSDNCNVPKAFLEQELKEKEQNHAVGSTNNLDVSREQKEIEKHITVGVRSNLESNKTDGDKLDLTPDSNNVLLSKRRSLRSQGGTSKKQKQVQPELEQESAEVLENGANAQKGEAMSTSGITSVEIRADRSSKYAPHKQVATEIEIAPILDANQCQGMDENEVKKSPDITPKEKAGRRSKHPPHRRDLANTTDNETDSLKVSTTPITLNANQSQQTENIETLKAQDITLCKIIPDTNMTENESSSLSALTKPSVLNTSQCQEVEKNDALKSPDFTPKGKAGRRSKHTPQKREVTNTTKTENDVINALTPSSIINASQCQQVSPDTPRGTLSKPNKRDVTDTIEHESSSLNVLKTPMVASTNASQCRKSDKTETLLSPDITPKRKSDRSTKTTPSRPDVSDTTENKSGSPNALKTLPILNANQCQKVEKNEILLSPDTTPKRKLDKTSKDIAHKREVTDSTDNGSALQVMLTKDLPQDSENNRSTHTKEPIDSGKSQSDTFDVTEMSDSSDMLSPLGTPKRKRGRPKRQSKDIDHKRKVTDSTENESAPQVMLTPNLPQDSENNRSTHNKEPIDSGKSQSDTFVVNEMSDSSDMLSPLGTLKKKRGKPKKHSTVKEDNSQSTLTEHISLLGNSPVSKSGQKIVNMDDGTIEVKRKRGRPRKTLTEEEIKESVISNCEDISVSQKLDGDNERTVSKSTLNEIPSTLQMDKIVDDLKIRVNGQIKSKHLLKTNNSKSTLENSQETENTSTQNVPTLFTGRKEMSNQSENLLDEEVWTINKLSSEATKTSSNADNKELKRAKSSLNEKLEQNNEFTSTGKLKDLNKISTRDLLISSPRKKRYSRRNSDFHEETEEINLDRRRRSKSCVIGRISDSATDEDDWCIKTRSRTSLGDKILCTTDDEGESDSENNISRRTRSKTSLGERISSGDDKDSAKVRSKSSLGEARSFVEHNVSVLPRRRTRRSSSVKQSLPLEEKRQSRSMNNANAEENRFKSNNDVKDGDTSANFNDSSKENIVDGAKREMSMRKKKVASTNESRSKAFPYSKPSKSRRSLQLLKRPQQYVKRRHSLGSKSDIIRRFKAIYKQEHKPFLPQLGDFVWAQFSNYPYWPSFVSKEPDSGLFTKIAKKGLSERTVHHVNFFGDKGRTAWIYNRRLMVYKNRNDLEKLYNTLQEFKAFAEVKAFFVRSGLSKKWTAAVDELEYVKTSGFDFKKITRFLALTSVSSDEESATDEDIEKLSKGKKSLDTENVDDQEEIVHVQKKIKLESDSPPTSKQKLSRKKLVKDSSEMSSEASYPLTEPKKEEPNDDDEVKDDSIEHKINPDTLRHFGSYSIDEQKALYKRNNLFKGVPKEKVCYYCFESGDLLKCKGGCNGLYHRYCASQVLVEKYPRRRKFRTSPAKSESMAKVENAKPEAVESLSPTATSPEVVEEPVKAPPVKTSEPPEVDDTHVQIVTVPSFRYQSPPKKTFPPDFVNMSLADQIDFKMKEIMGKFESTTYVDILSESSSDEKVTSSPVTKTLLENNVNKTSPSLTALVNNQTEESQSSNGQNVTEESVNADKTSPLLKPVVNNLTEESQSSNGQNVTEESMNADKTSPSLKPLVNNGSEESQSSNGQNVTEESMDADVDYTKDRASKHRAPTKHVTADCRPITHSKNSSHRVNGYRNPFAKHVTADSEIGLDSKTFKCGFCVEDIDPYCFICYDTVSKKGGTTRQKCSLHPCPRFYHPDCLKLWPQTQWSLIQTTKNRFSQEEQDSFVCPQHVCHTCASDDPRAAISRCPWDKIVKCLCCPASYHSTNFCIPAGTAIISTTQIVCPRHRYRTKPYTINTTWCLLCNEGGNLICCETCPTSIHPECMTVNLTDDDRFICEDCESGRLPLYDEVVWVKLGNYKWWPSLIIFPNEIPPKVQSTKHHPGEFVVKFFGTYDYYWMNRGRAFLFQEGDTIDNGINTKKKFQAAFMRAVEEAVVAHQMKKQFKILQAAETAVSMKPPPYIKIKVSKPVGNVRLTELDLSNTTACECDPKQVNPCGPDSNCLNRLLLTECHPEVCPAGKRCKNQSFEKREYPTLVPYRTDMRGWGLKTLEPIKKGQFVIEYVGELIDDEEYQRRIQKMHEQKEENYYFLTIYKDRMIDAGPKGNIARFMNHCCQPNCETQKWTVNGNTRVGLFATVDIPADTELTFNYNLECTGTEKKVCKCGAPNCSGFIGVKAKNDSAELRKPKKEKKKKEPEKPMELPPCYICQRKGRVSLCNNKICNKAYHLRCLKLKERPDSKKFVCPWHYCNVCSKRTIRCCVKCLNSFCPSHSEGNVRYDNLMGFVCHTHDPTNATSQAVNVTVRKRRSNNVTDEAQVSSTTTDNDDFDTEADSSTCRKSRKSKKTVEEDENIDFDISESCTSSPLKGADDESQDETVSSATVSDFEEEIRPKRKKKQIKKLRSKKRKLKFSNRKTINRNTITANSVNDTTESNLNVDM